MTPTLRPMGTPPSLVRTTDNGPFLHSLVKVSLDHMFDYVFTRTRDYVDAKC